MTESRHTLARTGTRRLLARLGLALVVLVAIAVFLELAGDVWLKEGFAWDAPLMLALHRLSRPWLDLVFRVITTTAGPYISLPVAVLAALLWYTKNRRAAVLIAASSAGAFLMGAQLKALFARPRPTVFPPLVLETSYSFPSGHTLSAVAFYGLLAILLWTHRRRVWAVLVGLWPLIVAVSRVYLGVHYPSDVLASLTIGIVWLAAIALIGLNSRDNLPA